MREENQEVQQAAEYINGIPKFSGRKHSMEELRRMLQLLDAAPENVNVIHVAGTNGKGSVCAFFNSILRTAGYHTAVFTSPHLLSIKERFCFDGREVRDPFFLNAFHQVQRAAAEWERDGLGHPTYFEFLFLMFWRMLRFYPVDYVILETGLGGRLDATNCIEQPLLSIITSISRDHVEYLGETIREIAGEKAGIIKAGIPVIYDACSAEANGVIQEEAQRKKSACFPVDHTSYRNLLLKKEGLYLLASRLNPACSEQGIQSELILSREKAEGSRIFDGMDEEAWIPLMIPFPAPYQAVNAVLALRAAELLGISGTISAEGIRRTVWQGRMEALWENVYIDGAHNEGGIRAFAAAAGKLAAQKKGGQSVHRGRTLLLFAVASDKDYPRMIELLLKDLEPDVLFFTQLSSARGLQAERLKQTVQGETAAWLSRRTAEGSAERRLLIFPTVREAVKALLKEKQPEDIAFCTGSLYLVGELKEIRKENSE